MEPGPRTVFRFGDVEVDPNLAIVRRGGSAVYLRQQTLQVLLHLLRHRDRVVGKQELFDTIWQGAAVTDDAVVQCIVEIRKAVGDDARTPRFLRTIPKLGYQIIGAIEEIRSGSLSPIATVAGPVDSPAVPRRMRHRLALRIAVPVLFLIASVAEHSTQSPVSRTIATAGVKRLAVGAFENQTGSSELAWLQRGLPDMLVTTLVQHQGIAITKQSQAQFLVRGSLTAAGVGVRVDARIYDRAGGLVGGASVVATDRTALLTQVDVLAHRIAQRLGGAPGALARRKLSDVMTDSLEAYRWYVSGLEKAHAMEVTDAVSAFEKAIAADPEFAMAYGRIGYCYALVHAQPERARPYLEKAFKLSGRLTDKDRANIAAWYAIAHREYDAAIAAYRQIIQTYPDETEAYWRLGGLLVGEDRLEEAVEVFELGNAMDPDSPEMLNGLGNSYLLMKRSADALPLYRRYVELAPSTPNAYDSLGLGLQEAGEYEKAMAAFERALELGPDFNLALLHLGNVLCRMGRYREALIKYDQFISASAYDVDKGRGHAYKAWAHLRRGEAAAASREATLGLELSGPSIETVLIGTLYGEPNIERQFGIVQASAPRPSRGSRELPRMTEVRQGYLALARGDTRGALAHFGHVRSSAAAFYHLESFDDVLAETHLNLGQYALAIAEYEPVLVQNPGLVRARFGFAQALEGAGHLVRAGSEYRKFLDAWPRADPDLPEIRIARTRSAALPR